MPHPTPTDRKPRGALYRCPPFETAFWELLRDEDFVPTPGTFTGNQAVQQVKARLKANLIQK